MSEPAESVAPGGSLRAKAHQFRWRYPVEPYTIDGRLKGKLLCLLAWPTLLVAMLRRSHRTELWIGDSHAMTVNRDVSNSRFMRAPDGQLILRAGPMLMFSIARRGFPEHVLRVARLVNRFGRRGALVPVFMAGEIDVRAHLASHPDETYDFVADYVAQCLRVAELLKAERVAFMVPIPPVELAGTSVWFPIVGTLEERLAIHTKLRHALADAVSHTPNAVLIDCTELLSGPTGGMPLELSRDSCHSNLAAVVLIREQIAGYNLLD